MVYFLSQEEGNIMEIIFEEKIMESIDNKLELIFSWPLSSFYGSLNYFRHGFYSF